MSLTVPPLYITSLKLVLPSQEEITCDLHRPLYDLSNISQVDVSIHLLSILFLTLINNISYVHVMERDFLHLLIPHHVPFLERLYFHTSFFLHFISALSLLESPMHLNQWEVWNWMLLKDWNWSPYQNCYFLARYSIYSIYFVSYHFNNLLQPYVISSSRDEFYAFFTLLSEKVIYSSFMDWIQL